MGIGFKEFELLALRRLTLGGRLYILRNTSLTTTELIQSMTPRTMLFCLGFQINFLPSANIP